MPAGAPPIVVSDAAPERALGVATAVSGSAPGGEPGVGAGGGLGAVTLDFVRPLVGLDDSVRYGLRPLGPRYEPYAAMVSLDVPDLSFVVVAPALLFADYVIEVPDDDCAQLGLDDVADVAVLAIVRRRGVPTPVVNLMAPIVVNRRSRSAVQVVLQDSGYGLMVPVDAGRARP